MKKLVLAVQGAGLTLWLFAILGFSAFYLYAGTVGLTETIGWGWALAAWIALFVARIAFPFAIGAFLASYVVWDWGFLLSVAFTLPFLVLAIGFMFASVLVEAFQKRDMAQIRY